MHGGRTVNAFLHPSYPFLSPERREGSEAVKEKEEGRWEELSGRGTVILSFFISFPSFTVPQRKRAEGKGEEQKKAFPSGQQVLDLFFTSRL